MKTCALISILLLSASCIVKSPKVESAGFNRLAPMMWSGEFPKTIQVSEKFNSDKITVIEEMAISWNMPNKTFYKIGNKLPVILNETYSDKDDDGIFGVYFVDPEDMPNYVPNTYSYTIAVTVLRILTQNYGKDNEYNEIRYADIYVRNDIPFRTSTSSPPLYSYDDYDFNSVMVHEFGHALGLEHVSSRLKTKDETVMHSTISEEYYKKNPLSYDIEQITKKYGIISGVSRPGMFAMAIERKNYVPDNIENKPFVKLIIELRSDGECTHSIGDKVFHTHKTNLK